MQKTEFKRGKMNMDTQDGQDGKLRTTGIPVTAFPPSYPSCASMLKKNRELKHGEITKAVIGCAFEVINELGAGFLESVYEKALVSALRRKGLSAIAQHPVRVMFRGECVGTFYADVLVEEKIVVELKAAKDIAPEHQAQLINYLKATGIEIGLLINFGNPKLEYKRFTRSKDFTGK